MSTTEHVEQQGDHVAAFPIALRTSDARDTAKYPQPHVGPDLAAYQAFHKQTVGGQQGSDEWWRKVRLSPFASGAGG